MNYFRKIGNQISNIELYIACLAMMLLTLLVTVNVVSRYLFNAPFIFADEISTYLFLAIIFFGLEYAWIKREHIRIEFIIRHLPAQIESYLGGFLHILWLGFCALLLAGTVNMVISSYQRNVHAYTALGTALYIPALIMPIGMAIFVIRLLVDTIQYLRKMANTKATDQTVAILLNTHKESD